MAAVRLWIKKQENGEVPAVLSTDASLPFRVMEARGASTGELKALAVQGVKSWLVTMQGTAEETHEMFNGDTAKN